MQESLQQKKTSLKKEILNLLKTESGWVHKGQLETFAKSLGYLGDNAGRRARELAAAGVIEKHEYGGIVQYRYKHPQPSHMQSVSNLLNLSLFK